MKLGEEHQFGDGKLLSRITSGNWCEVRTCRTIRPYRMTEDIAISGIAMSRSGCDPFSQFRKPPRPAAPR